MENDIDKEYYIVLSGAKKNIGDFLITERCKSLLTAHKPNRNLIQFPSWKSLDGHIGLINKSKAIIIMGGPGYTYNMYPNTYKLIQNINEINVPIIALGLGWNGIPTNNTLRKYTFPSPSLQLLGKINGHNGLSCRDYFTKELLKQQGFSNVIMTGCPVWYDLDSIGKKIVPPQVIKRIVFTTPQNILFKKQTIDIMCMLKDMFPETKIICSFNRGIGTNDEFTSPEEAQDSLYLSQKANELGIESFDVAYDLKKIQFYDDCDLHIGYRVHSHIYFLSKRKLSFLLHEDGRGAGMSEALNVKGIDAFQTTFWLNIAENFNHSSIFYKGIKKILGVTPNKYALHILKREIANEIERGFIRYEEVSNTIDNYYKDMVNFIRNLP